MEASFGWNIDYGPVRGFLTVFSTTPLWGVEQNWLGLLAGGCDTLLGPEGSGPNPCCDGGVGFWLLWLCRALVVPRPPQVTVGWWGQWLGLACLYVENYTVDASIFVALSF